MRPAAVIAILCLALSVPAEGQRDEVIEAAEVATRAWLGLVDSGRYAESWDASSSLFRKALPSEGWVATLEGVRASFGATLSRETADATYATELPGAPDGEYVVFRFDTSFENKASAVETVTAMKDTDGAWHVSGYYIR